MDALPIWQDDLAWMEAMKGPRWASYIREKQKGWAEAVDCVKGDILVLKAELDGASKLGKAPLFRAAGGLEIAMDRGVSWKWHGEQGRHSSANIFARRGGYVWATEEDGEGAEIYAIRLYRKGKGKGKGKGDQPIWEHRGIAPHFAIVGDRCYCLDSKKTLVYFRLISWNAYTGKDYQVHYEEKDYRYNLELIKGGDDQHAYMRRQSGEKQDAFMISNNNKISLLSSSISLESRRFIFGSQAGEYLLWESGLWLPSLVLRRAAWKLPLGSSTIPEQLDTGRGLLVTKWYGCRTLWRISKTELPHTLWKGIGQILIDPWDSGWIRITQPACQPIWWDSEGANKRPPTGFSMTHSVSSQHVKGSNMPFILCSCPSREKSKGLLVIGYGAYGLSTPLGTERWDPLLKRGWAIAIGFWRGGGDHTPEWEDAGRPICPGGREKVLEEAEGVVRRAQELTGCSAKNTVIYGRSAGGLWVGGLVARNPGGSLMGGAYMEVPYLDVMRTITNSSLPLTEIETDEFGFPEQRLTDFAAALRWSPMNLLASGSGPMKVWQIVRTGLNDSEVLAYESAKWVARCGKKALLAVEGGQGHFVKSAVGLEQQAADLAIILGRN